MGEQGMPYADELLASGEKIVRRERQHWIFPFLVAGRWVALAALVTIGGVLLTQLVFRSDGTGIIGGAVSMINTVLTWITIVALVFAVVGLVWSAVRWQSQEYVLTDRRLVHAYGVINKQASDSSLENITDAQIRVPWLGRMLGYGDLKFMTASEAGIEDLQALPDPIEFKKALIDAKSERLITINTARVPAAAPAPAEAPAPIAPAAPAAPAAESAETVTAALSSLAALRDAGTITPDEFEAKKKELLERI
jgi:uncharacterized membrane protein YdbT with pleckstrin-like domain